MSHDKLKSLIAMLVLAERDHAEWCILTSISEGRSAHSDNMARRARAAALVHERRAELDRFLTPDYTG